MSATGIALLFVVGLAVAAGALVVWRRPAVSLGVFAAGLAIHNLVLMFLVTAEAPTLGIRAVQAWKELYVGLLGLRLVVDVARGGGLPYLRDALARWRRQPAIPRAFDVIAVAFAVLLVIYLLIPSSLLPQPSPTITQRILSFRTLILLPVLYACGRIWSPFRTEDRRLLMMSVVAVAAFVSIAGLVELWFIPTQAWYVAGIYRYDVFTGYRFVGPGGLPENFFQSTTTGFALRRMVSTYLSPLGVAYTALLVVPMALAGVLASPRHRRWWWAGLVLTLIAVALALTRLALACLAVEAILMAVLLHRRAAFAAAILALAAAASALLVYPNVGPVVDYNLNALRPALGGYLLGYDTSPYDPLSPNYDGTSPVLPDNLSADILNRISSSQDESIQAHLNALPEGTKFVLEHPLGLGLGSSVPRYGSATGPSESAVLGIGGEVGLLGLVLFSSLYGGLVLVGCRLAWKYRREPDRLALPLVLAVGGIGLGPIVLTSQVWGDPSVTYVFWWIAGACIAAWPRSAAVIPEGTGEPAEIRPGDLPSSP